MAHVLIGAGVHLKDENGVVDYQARIIDVIPSNSPVGDLALVEFFEWMLGERSTRRLVPLSEMAGSDRWVLYESVDDMKRCWEAGRTQ